MSEDVKITAVYDLDYPEKTKIIDSSVKRTNTECVKAIKKILTNNASFDINIAKAFFKLAPEYNIDPVMVIAQSILETGWFKYQNSAVKAEQHNYCGLGVTGNGVTGASFKTIEDGVRAQLQHLFAYGCKTALPSDETILDPRYSLVTRGIATYWQQLAGRWACPGYDSKTYSTPKEAMEAENTYGQKILTICKSILSITVSDTDINKYFPKAAVSEEKTVAKSTVEQEQLEKPANNNKTESTNSTELIINTLKKLITLLTDMFNKGD